MSKISKDVATSTSKAIELSGTVINELINVVLQGVGSIVEGVNSVAEGAGNVTDNVMGNKIGVKTTQIFKDAGVTAKQASDSLGKVVKTIPLVGGTVAYVVERGGNGIYHVVVSVGNIIGNSSKKIGKVVKKTTDLIVFTLSSVNDEIQEIGKEIASIITNLTERKQSGGSRKNKRRSNRSNRRKSRRNSSKRRGGEILVDRIYQNITTSHKDAEAKVIKTGVTRTDSNGNDMGGKWTLIEITKASEVSGTVYNTVGIKEWHTDSLFPKFWKLKE